MKNLIKNLQNFSHEHELFEKESKIVLGISGGPDSMCMLDVFSHLQKKYSLEIIVAHVNYHLRGKDSQKDQELVQKRAQELGFKFALFEAKIRDKKNLEEKCRQIRYDFFEKVRKENKFNLIAIAHNADDQVETFFLHLMRGAGTKGLSGMQAKNNKIIRPLLFAWKKDILEYNKKNKINFRLDKTNKETTFTRNKIRNLLIPYLEKKFNPNIKKGILKTIQNIKKEESRLFLEIFKEVSGNSQGISSSHVKEFQKILKSSKKKTQKMTFRNLKIERRGDKITIEKI